MPADTLIGIIKEIKEKQIVLPSFQRSFEWDPNQQRNLLASVLTNIPCTSSLIVKIKS